MEGAKVASLVGAIGRCQALQNLLACGIPDRKTAPAARENFSSVWREGNGPRPVMRLDTEISQERTRGSVPYLDGTVVVARDELATVGGKGGSINGVLVSRVGAQDSSGREVPEVDTSIGAQIHRVGAREGEAAIGCKCHSRKSPKFSAGADP